MLKNTKYGSTTWTDGFWKERFELCQNSILPNIYSLLDDKELSHNLENFKIASGLTKGDFNGPSFGDGDFYKWLEGASYVYGKTKDKDLGELLDNLIEMIAKIQREDGYIYTENVIQILHGQKIEEGVNSFTFQAYNLGHLISAGCVHYRMCGKQNLLKVAIKAGNYLACVYERASKTHDVNTAICPSHYIGLIDLYETVNDKRYLEAASLAINLRDFVKKGTDDNQDRVKLREADEIVGHAVRSTYLYAGVARLYYHTKDESLVPLLKRLWNNEEETKMYINSGIGALYDGVSPSGYAGDNPDLNRTHQSFGRPYELPNLTAYNETCATIGNVFWCWSMFLNYQEVKYIDRLEQSFLNLIFASVSLDGKLYFYSNMLERDFEPLPFFLKWERTRTPYLASFCCPPNMFRISAESSEYAFALSENGTIYTALYGDCIYKGSNFELIETTSYPYDGKINFSYKGKGEKLSLNLRIPSWCNKATLMVNGKTIDIDSSNIGKYYPLDLYWDGNTEVVLDLALKARKLVADRRIEGCNNKLAVMYGPVLYCSESADNGNEIIHIASDAEFVIAHKKICGVDILSLRTKQASVQNYKDELYSDICDTKIEQKNIELIPYFAWDNREKGRMQTWFNIDWKVKGDNYENN